MRVGHLPLTGPVAASDRTLLLHVSSIQFDSSHTCLVPCPSSAACGYSTTRPYVFGTSLVPSPPAAVIFVNDTAAVTGGMMVTTGTTVTTTSWQSACPGAPSLYNATWEVSSAVATPLVRMHARLGCKRSGFVQPCLRSPRKSRCLNICNARLFASVLRHAHSLPQHATPSLHAAMDTPPMQRAPSWIGPPAPTGPASRSAL